MTLRTKYDKLVEINKQLMADIKVMACCTGWEAIEMRLHWQNELSLYIIHENNK